MRAGAARTQPRAGQRAERAARDRVPREHGRTRLDLEAVEPSGVAREAQQPRRIVDEAPLVQHPQPPGLEIGERGRRGAQLPRPRAAELDRDRVDGEVAPLRGPRRAPPARPPATPPVPGSARAANGRSRTCGRRARRSQSRTGRARGARRRCATTRGAGSPSTTRSRSGAAASEQQVANGAADQIHALLHLRRRRGRPAGRAARECGPEARPEPGLPWGAVSSMAANAESRFAAEVATRAPGSRRGAGRSDRRRGRVRAAPCARQRLPPEHLVHDHDVDHHVVDNHDHHSQGGRGRRLPVASVRVRRGQNALFRRAPRPRAAAASRMESTTTTRCSSSRRSSTGRRCTS